jgi:transcriptional regulator with XRE-family HTH domain
LLREQRSWSQDRLAEGVGCSKNQISDLERGNRGLTLVWMQRIATALGVSPGELLPKADNPLPLTDEEQQLIELYRISTPDQRATFLRVAYAILRPPKLAEDPLAARYA